MIMFIDIKEIVGGFGQIYCIFYVDTYVFLMGKPSFLNGYIHFISFSCLIASARPSCSCWNDGKNQLWLERKTLPVGDFNLKVLNVSP